MFTFILWSLIVFQIVLVIFFAIMMYIVARGIFGVPWIRTNKKRIEEMLELAGLLPGETLVDFGSGDGIIPIYAAQSRGAKGIGFEYLRMLHWWAQVRSRWYKTHKRVQFYREDFLKREKLPHADVVTSYLFPEVNAALEPLLIRDYPSGTRVVSRTFLFPTLPLKKTKVIHEQTFYLYEIP